MQPDLPASYYLDNVKILFEHVEKLYHDILEPEQLAFISRFSILSEDAQKLYIRLLNRSHELFRLGKLHYPEIDSMSQACAELTAAGMLLLDPQLDEETLLGLFTRAELLALCDDAAGLKSLKRAELEQHLLGRQDAPFFTRLEASDSIVAVLQKDRYQRMQMLFFGNLNQSMTDFVLSDLGLNRYEQYRIDGQTRPYRNQLEIKQHWLLHQVEQLFTLAEPDDSETLAACFDAVPSDCRPGSPMYRMAERIKHQVARQFERLGQLSRALQYYRQCQLPPSRERIARVLQQQGEAEAALVLCQTMFDVPISEEESQFVLGFAPRLAKKQGLALPAQLTPTLKSVGPEVIELELPRQASVEQSVVDYYAAQQDITACYFLENSLFNGVLGLLIWDAMFAPVEGAFYNPFQQRPADFYAHDFSARRAGLLQATWASLRDNTDMLARIRLCWKEKQGLMNPLVNWPSLSLEIIELALARIEFAHWMRIFERILRDLRHNRAGFPDLVVFPAAGGYHLIEVKGPGDTLRKNQQRWMQYFSQHEIPHALVRVRWSDPQ